ncbi:MAG: protein-glutamate O-methyltransferase CheR [candidate division WOR-3 bacterium]
MENNFVELIQFIEKKTSFPCTKYKVRPLQRRIRVRMRDLGIVDFSQYYEFLKNNPEEFEKLLSVMTINLSYFFRNPETFNYLKESIFVELSKKERLIFWSAGCAQGEEPYSLALLAAEMGMLERIKIYGTDIDQKALSQAKEGIYLPGTFQYTPQYLIEKYFNKKNNHFQIIEEIRSVVEFYNLDLFSNVPFRDCDLIMCRNVLIYLQKEAQSELLLKFYKLLKPAGYLVIGKVELLLGIPEAKFFEPVSQAERIYRKI